jgi:hypothetical protein
MLALVFIYSIGALADETTTVPPQAMTSGAESGTASAPASDQNVGNTKATPLQGHITRVESGVVRSLPPGRQPDFIIGHFGIGVAFLTIPVNKPIGNGALLSRDIVQHWHGKKFFPCPLKLIKIKDGSDGYYFQSVISKDGPHGWLMPMPKRPGVDKVIPWAIYYDQ